MLAAGGPAEAEQEEGDRWLLSGAAEPSLPQTSGLPSESGQTKPVPGYRGACLFRSRLFEGSGIIQKYMNLLSEKFSEQCCGSRSTLICIIFGNPDPHSRKNEMPALDPH
jgi:hypothetical protein